MPFKFTLGADASESHASERESISLANSSEETTPGLALAQLASTLASHADESVAADLALDLVLNEIVEQARLETSASGAAVALKQNDELICRASSGPSAPGLGIRLSLRSGLSAACAQSRQVQHCPDTELDPAADASACRALGVRSILMTPVLDGEKLVGIFELFSERAGAFGDAEVRTVLALARRVIENLHAGEKPAALSADVPAASVMEAGGPYSSEFASAVKAQKDDALFAQRLNAFYTDILTAIVVGLAVLLGWIVGRSGWEQAKLARQRQSGAQAAVQIAPASPIAAAPENPKPQPQAQVNVAKPTKKESPKEKVTVPAGGLVVYDKGQVVFQLNPSGAPTGTAAAMPAAKVSSDHPGYVPLSPEVAARYLIERVEPFYPEKLTARENVVLEVFVNPDGTVADARQVSGDAQLATATRAAVLQWHFRPYAPGGTPLQFRTRVTLAPAAR